jgi:hypothetical protein
MQPETTLFLRLRPTAVTHFGPLFSTGVGIPTIVGIGLTELLCQQLAIDPDYVANRIQTIFLNSRAVDRTEQVTVPAGAVIALSAAMPGLAGATFRKGGLLAGFRKDISHQYAQRTEEKSRQETLITLKLFNLVAQELGPHLLAHGVWIDGLSVPELLSRIASTVGGNIQEALCNGRPIPSAQLAHVDWPNGWVALAVAWQASSPTIEP